MNPGTVVGPYEILSALGAGGMGEVYAARDTRLNRRVALKILAATVDEARRQRFLTEARAAAALSHPNVATIYDVGDASGTHYIALELVEGRTLADRIKDKPMAADELVALAIQIAEALQAAHDRGIVHRDVKPANLMIAASGQVKVLDFGLAKVTSPAAEAQPDATRELLTHPGTVMGTVAYMSPEQAMGEALDHRTDLFALGIVLYEAASGRLPFDGSTDWQIVDAIRHADPEPIARHRSGMPLELERIIRKSIEKRPERRYQSARELVDDLQAFRSGASPSGRTGASARHNLPAERTSFIGREKELSELPRLLTAARLLSLVGAGGAGKTRLALRVSAEVTALFPDGVWFVDLAALSSPELLAQTIATAVSIREGQERPVREALLEGLRQRQLVLVLDNCEHLVEACAEIAEAILQAAPGVRLMATSREPLGVPGETVYRVRSLAVPEAAAGISGERLAAYESTRLFIARAKTADPTFVATEQNAETIARICQRLDGIPLAIELAAARTAVLTVEQIDARLQDCFRLLTGGARTAVARQRTLEATVDWSYQLLSDLERRLFARLAVFPSGWTLDAAERICSDDGVPAGAILDLLSALVSKSLVSVESAASGSRRYRFLETVRQYARDKLAQQGDVERMQRQHFEFFWAEFRGAMPVLRGPDEIPCLRRIHLEEDSIRAALDWGLESAPHVEAALELATALFWYWTKRGQFREGQQWLERALARATAAGGSQRARGLIGLAHMYHFQGQYPRAGACGAEAFTLGTSSGDAWSVSFALFSAGLSSFERGNLDEADRFAVAAREAANAGGEAIQHGGPLMLLGDVAVARGNYDEAQKRYDESIDVHRQAGEKWGRGIVLSIAAALRIVRGNRQQASSQILEAFAIHEELEDPRGMAWTLAVLGSLLAASDDTENAARVWGVSAALLEQVGGSLPPSIRWSQGRFLGSATQRLGEARFDELHSQGRPLPLRQVIELVRTHIDRTA